MKHFKGGYALLGAFASLYVFAAFPELAASISYVLGSVFGGSTGLILFCLLFGLGEESRLKQLLIAVCACAFFAIVTDPFSFARAVHASVPWNWDPLAH